MAPDDGRDGAAPGPVPRRVVVRSGRQWFALPAACVQQVLPLVACTRLPGAPPFVRGVMAVRGLPLPVLDLAHALGHPPAAAGEATVLAVHAGGHAFGVVVEDVEGLEAAAPATAAGDMGHFAGRIVLPVDLSALARSVFVDAGGGDHVPGEEHAR